MLSNIAEAAGITPLAKTAEILKGIVEIIEVIKREKIQRPSRILLQFTSELHQSLNKIVPTSGGTEINDDLHEKIKGFQQYLEDSQETLKGLGHRSRFGALWHAERDEKVLAGFKEKSNRFITSLNLHVSLEVLHMISPGTKVRQNATITYESIKLATPMAPGVFTGRDELVTAGVDKLCQAEPAQLAILGAGGMGKTSLALHIMEHAKTKMLFRTLLKKYVDRGRSQP
ncbi:hypothetical protein BT96DRAFT_982517 [Gymnopus androsaceus JB14]|uniref:NB-ARC domain-containing protein n=1 Tax=Gymnopus androsaceus JB14 TaxID=1447944 RepID=A0A6A4GDE0_9AGAR|nr:hypothetical protein BT96DRAFT_982517 [Gymnopus androsaceus JB14]